MKHLSRGRLLRRVSIALLLIAVVLPASAAGDAGPIDARPFLDLRAGERAEVPDAVAAARRALDGRLGALGAVVTEPATGGVGDVRRPDGFLTGPSDRDPQTVALSYVRARPDVFGLDADDLAALRLDGRSASPDGIVTLRWVQTVDGIASFDTGIVAHVASDGRLIAIGGGARPDLSVQAGRPALGAAAAYGEALADAGAAMLAPRADTAAGPERATDFSDGGHAELAVLAGGAGGRLVWRTVAYGDDGLGYEQAIDARDGTVRVRRPLTAHEHEHEHEHEHAADVYRRYPGAHRGGEPERVDLGADPTWLDDHAGLTRLRGNNAHVYSDRTPDNVAGPDEDVPAADGRHWRYPLQPVPSDGPCPAAPAFCTWNGADPKTLAINERSSATNLFFHVNLFHDHLLQAPIGFDEASGNFEQVNASGSGRGGDRLLAENDDGRGFDNANFGTPPDGTSPRMQMYPRRAAFDLSGSLSAETIYHEYTHGLTNRLVVSPAGSSTLIGEQATSMGEGWSDWFALDFLQTEGYAVDGPAPGDLSYGEYWSGVGIRRQAIDCGVGTSTGRCSADGGAYTYQDIRTLTAPHGSGEMWAQTLWDVRRSVGSAEARRLVVGGLRLSPPDPTYVEMRDAILLADLATGAGHRTTLWKAFAARGLGASASSAATRVVAAAEAFDLPAPTVADDPAVLELTGDHDGAAEPGETVEVRPDLLNTSSGPLAASTGAVSSATAGVRVDSGAVAWPALPGAHARAASTTPVALTIDDAVPCGTPAHLSAAVAGGSVLPFGLRIGAPGELSGATAWTTSTALRARIPDGASGGVSSTIVVPEPGVPIQDLDLRIDDLDHGWIGDLQVHLQHDSGKRVTLVDHPDRGDAPGGSLSGTVLDDDAPRPLAAAPRPYAGPYRPASPLSRFAGPSSAGTWKLTVVDPWPGSTGSLGGWSIGFAKRDGCEDNTARATTTDATGITSGAATLGGAIDAKGHATQWRVAYGPAGGPEHTTPIADAGAARTAVQHEARVTSLQPATTYRFRVEALRSGSVVTRGAFRAFSTPATTSDEPAQDDRPAPSHAASDPPVASPAPPAPAVTGQAPRATPVPPRPATLAIAAAPAILRARHGRMALTIVGGPGGRGTVTIRMAGSVIAAGRFTQGRSRSTRVTVSLRPDARAALRRAGRRGRLVTVTARLGRQHAIRQVRLGT